MGKTILTPKQSDFLELAQSTRQITKRFYLTGGTALSEFYLHHRLSEDIDLFTEKEEVNYSLTSGFIKRISPKLGIVGFNRSQFLGLVSYKLKYKDGDELKVDFNFYPFPRIEKGVKFENLEVDSLLDIATNKIHTLFMRPRTRDYIDLYFLFQHKHFDLEKLILFAKAKFDWDIDRVNLSNQFIRVKDLKNEEYPDVLLPFDTKEMEAFFLKLAKSLESEIFK